MQFIEAEMGDEKLVQLVGVDLNGRKLCHNGHG